MNATLAKLHRAAFRLSLKLTQALQPGDTITLAAFGRTEEQQRVMTDAVTRTLESIARTEAIERFVAHHFPDRPNKPEKLT